MRSPAVGLALLAAVLAAACTSDSPTLLPSAPRAAAAPVASTCDGNQLKADAQAYFASTGDAVYAIIKDVAQKYKTGASTTTDRAFDGLARIAAVRGTADQKASTDGTQGAAIALDFFGCMRGVTAPAATDLANALNPGGLFAVRGGSADNTTTGVFARYADATLRPVWGAQPQTGLTWGGSATGRVLLYGWTYDSDDANHAAIAQPAAPQANTAFEMHVAPAGAFAKWPIVGECGYVATDVRVLHTRTDGIEILGNQPLACDGTLLTADAGASPSRFGTMARAVAGFLAPARAYAQEVSFTGTAGLPSEFSPFQLKATTGTLVAWVNQPSDGAISKVIVGVDGTPVTVHVTTGVDTQTKPFVRALVTIVVANNSGQIVAASGNQARTDDDGYATFPNLKVNKAGGYTLSIVGADGLGNTLVSNLFQMKNK